MVGTVTAWVGLLPVVTFVAMLARRTVLSEPTLLVSAEYFSSRMFGASNARHPTVRVVRNDVRRLRGASWPILLQ